MEDEHDVEDATPAADAADETPAAEPAQPETVVPTESAPSDPPVSGEAPAEATSMFDALSADGSSVTEIDAPVIEVPDTELDQMEEGNSREPLQLDDSLLNGGEDLEDLDYGDGDDKAEDMVTFQIEESEILIVETGKKGEGAGGEEETAAKEEDKTTTTDEKKSSDKKEDTKSAEKQPDDEG